MRLRIPKAYLLKRLFPRSLLWRGLLMILLPLVVVQAVALAIFYGNHLDFISRRFALSVAGEVAMTVDLLQRYPDPATQRWVLAQAWRKWEMRMVLEPKAKLPGGRRGGLVGPVHKDLEDALHQQLRQKFTIDWASNPQSVLIRVQLKDAVLDVRTPRKQLYSGTIYLFVIWLVGSALILFVIAALFMRNQVRAIRRLAVAAEAFGMGRDRGPIKPEGATEVRQAAVAFNRMQERVRRFLQQRTEMLAGVSHDLRTPLTRLRLALAMLPAEGRLAGEVAEMTTDVEEMERMIGSYLAFARGEGSEQPRPTEIAPLLEEVAEKARRGGADVALSVPPALVVELRSDAIRRAITNLVDNASRHARHVALAAAPASARWLEILVDDDGPGIAPEAREAAFRPFESASPGGLGLGLTIARDIVRAHGGDIALETSPLGGLRARVLLPL